MNSHVVAWGSIIGVLDSKHFSCLRSLPRNHYEHCIGGIQSQASEQAVELKPLIRISREPFGKEQTCDLPVSCDN